MAVQLEGSIEAVEVERNFVAAILETAGALVVVLDPQGQIVRFNRACEQITHYSFSEVNGCYIWDLFLNADSTEQAKAKFESFQAGNFPQQYEGSWITKEGQIRFISWSDTALLDEQGSVEYIVKTGIDITERKQAEEELIASEQRLSLLFHQTSLAVMEWNLDYKIVSWNLAAEKIFGYTADEMIGHNAVKFLVPEPLQTEVDQIMRNLQKQTGGGYSANENLTKDGRTIICE